MKQEDKELLLKDLCTRLPYGVKCHIGDSKPYTLSSISNDYDGILIRFKEQKNGFNMEVYLSEVKPYLFPLSSMTEEQKKFFKDKPIFLDSENELMVKEDFFGNSRFTMLDDWMEVIDWLNKNHFDCRGLIEKGLAIDCTNLNIY